jgi:hypothetical protein
MENEEKPLVKEEYPILRLHTMADIGDSVFRKQNLNNTKEFNI